MLDTFFDSAERSSPEVFDAQRQTLSATPLALNMLESTGTPAAILNPHREILAGNAALAEFCGSTPEDLVRRRIGEVLGCIHATDGPAGCGTTPACSWCGAAQALRESRLQNIAAGRECRISLVADQTADALNALIHCTPVTIGGVAATVMVLRDVADQERRHVLERMFFHDALNAAGGLQGLMEAWPDFSPEEAAALAPAAAQLAGSLVEQIRSHRDLCGAEDGTLVVQPQPVVLGEVLARLHLLYSSHPAAEAKQLRLVAPAGGPRVVTDPVLLERVVGNLVKNALEASRPGDAVTITCAPDVAGARVDVHNLGLMPDSAKYQVFQRAFSTKGRGRGLGTYGARLITERYLRGHVQFTTSAEDGTTFSVSLPTLINLEA